MLWVKFNNNGQFIGQANVGSLPFAGTDEFQIFAVFDGINLDNYGAASLKLYKPDLQAHSDTVLAMTKREDVAFDGTSNDYFSVGTSYSGFYFDFRDYANEDGSEILDTAGNWRAVITLLNVNPAYNTIRNVQGSVIFEVGNGVESEDSGDVSLDDILTSIYRQLGNKLNIASPDYVKTINEVDVSGFVFGDAYNYGDVIINRHDLKVYQLDANKEPVFKLDLLNLQDKLTAGANIIIDENNVISSVGSGGFYMVTPEEFDDDVLVLSHDDVDYIIANKPATLCFDLIDSKLYAFASYSEENIIEYNAFVVEDESVLQVYKISIRSNYETSIFRIDVGGGGLTVPTFDVYFESEEPDFEDFRMTQQDLNDIWTNKYPLINCRIAFEEDGQTIYYTLCFKLDFNVSDFALKYTMTGVEFDNEDNHQHDLNAMSFIIILDEETDLPAISAAFEEYYTNDYNKLENKPNIPQVVTTIGPDSLDDTVPSSKCVYDAIDTIKKDAYIEVDITIYPTLADFLTSSGEEGFMYLYPIDTSDLTKGYYRYIWENSSWINLGTTTMDLTNYVTLNGTQTITGTKTFESGLTVGKTNTDTKLAIIGRYGTNYIYTGTSNQLCFDNLNQPQNAAYINTSEVYIGDNRNLKIKANKTLTDGTNSVTIADIVNKSNANNLENGTGTNAAQEKMADATVDFTGRNANAEALDPTISATINTGASGNQSVAIGKNTMALATASFTNGNKTLAKGEESHAEGYQSVTLGDGSHAEGAQTVAKGIQSHSEGALTQAIGDQSHAEGQATISGAIASHTEGVATKTGNYSQESGIGADQTPGGGGSPTPPVDPYVAEFGEGSHSEGYSNVVKGCGSHAEGLRNYLAGNYAHVEGVNNTNSGDYSDVAGFNNINSGECAFVTGVWNNNSGYNAFVVGEHNNNQYDHKFVAGRYNQNKQGTLFEVGNGTSNAENNAFEVYADGTVKASGTVYLSNNTVASIGIDFTNQYSTGTIKYSGYQFLFSGAITAGAINPNGDNVRDLGSSGAKWKDLYVGGQGNIQNLSVGNMANIHLLNYSNAGSLRIYNQTSGTDQYNINDTNIRPATDGAKDLGASSYRWKDLYLSGKIYATPNINLGSAGDYAMAFYYNASPLFQVGTSSATTFTNILPSTDNSKDIGSSSLKFKDGYFSGQVYAQNTFNVINATDIVDNTLTQAQYDLITNGKPTIIKGTLINGIDAIYVYCGNFPTNAVFRRYTRSTNTGYFNERTCVVNLSTKVISELNATEKLVDLQNIQGINGKIIPSYPTTNTNPQALTIGANGGNLSWEDIGSGSGTNVVANPTLAGTESDLIGLEVAGTKYRVPQFEIQSNLKGKKISFIGDSITTYSGYLPSGNVTRYPRGAITNVDQTWWKQLIDQTGMVLGQNCAWDGSTCIGRSTSTTNAYGACSAKRISQLGLNGNPDIIVCFIGINDWGATYNNTGTHYGSPFTNGAFVPVGSYTGETTAPSGDLQTFSEAYGSMIYNIQVNYPNAKIYCCTLLQTNGKATYNYDADGAFPSINRNGVTLAAYNECIRTLAKNIGAEVIEFAKCGINWGNMSTYLEDGLHPNVAGMKLLCASAKAKLEADFGYTTESFTPLQTFSVTNNLTNVTNSNNSTTASESTTYSASLTADTGYTISNVTVTMGGTDITSSAYSNGVINIGNVTGNIVITASATLNVYSITNSLTNVTNSNQATTINHGNSYSATLTMPSGYNMQSVSIQMGGVDITSSVYSNNNISISSVTGNIIITAVATNQVTYSITNNLSNVTNSNASVSIIQGTSYSATLTPSTHYELQTANVSVLMGGTDVTATVYDGSNKTISIPSVTGALVINATATIITHTITNTLTHTTNSNNAVSANDGSSYSGTLTADTGYNISSVSVTMGGVDITSTAYNNGVITISSVTGDIVIECVSTAVVYSITNNLTNATSDNAATTINYGGSYSATITATSGYAITSANVTMGGVDITNTAYDNGVISIASVTGNLVITVTAADPAVITWYTNFSQTSTSSFVAASRGWALDEVTYGNIYNKPINRISLVATASSGSIDICVAPSYNAQTGFTQQQTINWTSDSKVGNIVTLELPTPITLAPGEYLCVYVNSSPATGVACYASGGNAGQFYSYVGSSGRSWGAKGTYSIQMNIGYKA